MTLLTFVLGLVVGLCVGWVCAFMGWPTSLYARALVLLHRDQKK